MSNYAQQIEFLISENEDAALGTATVYLAGTSTLATIWTTRDKSVIAANPYTLNANGSALLYADGVVKIDVKDSAGVSVPGFPRDNLSFGLQNGPWVDVEEYASLTAAVTAIGSTPTRLLINSTTTLTANATIPSTLALEVTPLGRINQGTYPLAINGPFSAGLHQVFTGTGAVTGLGESDSIWFGAKGDGVTDDTTAFNRAFASAPIVNTYNTGSTYLVTSITGITTGKTWRGHGFPKVKRSTSTGYLIGAFTGKSDIEITGIDFDGDSTAANSFIIVIGNSCNNINIHNNRFKNANSAMYVSASASTSPYNISFEHNYVKDCAYGTYNIMLKRSSIRFNTFECVDLTTNILLYGTVIIGNISVDCSENKVIGNALHTISGVSLQIDSAITGTVTNVDNTIARNDISGVKEEGISLDESASSIKFAGTATAGGTNSLTDSGATFTTLTGYYAVIVAGTGAGQYRYIASNTTTAITVSPNWTVIPDATSQYFIGSIQRDNKIIGNTLRSIAREGILIYGAAISNLIAENVLTSCNTAAGSATACIGVRSVNLAAGASPAFHNSAMSNIISDATNVTGLYIDVYNAVSPSTRTSWQSVGNVAKSNIIGNNCAYGIRLNNATQTLVALNTLHNCINGVRADDESVHGNIFSDNNFIGVTTNYSNFSPVEQYGTDSVYAWNASPTSGAWKIASRVYDTTPAASTTPGWINTKAASTTVRVAAAATDTIIEVVSTTGILAGDGIGIVLDDWSIHWTTVASITDGDTLVLTAGIPVDRSAPIGRFLKTFLFKTMAALGA